MSLKVGVASSSSAKLKVSVAKPPTKKSKVTYNYGSQAAGHYNPQKTAPAKKVQAAASAHRPQPTHNPRPKTFNPRPPQPTAAQVQAAAEAQRRAVAAEVARQKELKRRNVQGQLDTKIGHNEQKFKLRVEQPGFTGRLSIGRYRTPVIHVPKMSGDEREYQSWKDEAKRRAMQLVDSQNSTSLWGMLGDKVSGNSFSQDSRRQFAQSEAERFGERQMKVYESKIDAHTKLQARLQAEFEARKNSLSTAQLNALAAKYNAQILASLQDVRKVAAYTEGTLEGYGLKSNAKLTGRIGQTASFINRNVVQKVASNPVWKYTLGEGSRNIPSLVTAPSRVVNFVGNLNTKDRTIHKYGGENTSRIGSKDNAWQTSFNQRNFNIRPTTNKNIWARGGNTALELAADPLNFLGGAAALAKVASKSSKVTKYTSKLGDVARNTKYISNAMKASDKIKQFKTTVSRQMSESKIGQFLNKEHKTPQEQLSDAIDAAKKAQGAKQSEMLVRINSINKRLLGTDSLDVSVFDDFARLTDHDANILQRMVNGKLTARDRLFLAGRNNKPIRENLEAIASKWNAFTEQMRLADNVKNTRFGRGKRFYSPRTVWTRETDAGLDDYNFRKFKKNTRGQTATDLRQGAIDRYFKSDLDQAFSNSKSSKRARLLAERDELLKRYDDTIGTAKRSVQAAENRAMTARKYFKIRRNGGNIDNISKARVAVNTARSVVQAPTKIWKKSVLKYRPAWTVNNVLYNTQAGMLSGGLRYLPEQARMLRPKYARRALRDVPDEVRSNLAKEIGSKGRLNRFYADVENNPRIAAYRALVKKGLTPEQALTRVDKYFFNYKTRNWERPLKAVMPFWSFQKNLTKASANMVFDRPQAAIAYNRIERYNKQQFEKDFQQMVPELLELGYTEEEIQVMKEEQAKKFAKRLKIAGQYRNTPFNAFSEQGLTSLGINPYLSTAIESSEGVDSFGRKISGNEASILRRLTTKFPQAELGYKWYKGKRVDMGLDKPSVKYIGKEGSEGYGMTKERQGYDPTKSNYVANLDPRTKNKQDLSAFFGKPRGLEFDKSKFLQGKKLQKVTAEYFSKSADWKDMDYEKAQAAQDALFKKYGMSADDFYKGVLSKYDTDHTKKIKGLKETAAAKNKSLFEAYARQPKGTRNLWATKKLDELVAARYFDDNPFLKSFKWLNKESYGKAAKQRLVQHALKTGDWSSYRKKYGMKKSQKSLDYQRAKSTGNWATYTKKYGVKSQKALAYRKAKSSGNWTEYREKYGTKQTSKESPYQYAGKYFKSAASMKRYKEGEFWRKYVEADKTGRQELLAKNPEYNRRADWTNEQWDKWKTEQRVKQRQKLRGYKNTGKVLDRYLAENNRAAETFKSARSYKAGRKYVAYR